MVSRQHHMASGRILPSPMPSGGIACWCQNLPDSTRQDNQIVHLKHPLKRHFLPVVASAYQMQNHSHSMINRPPKPAWLKDLAVIDMGLYRRFYRQKRRSFAGAGDGAICGGATFSTLSSIKCKHTEKRTAPQDSPRSPERALRLRQQCSQNFGGAVKL